MRTASAADLTRVLEILAQSTAIADRPGDPPGPATAAPKQVTAWERMRDTADLTVLLAEHQNGEAVGTATMLIMPTLSYDCRPTAFIEAVVVKYAHRRRGIARLLVEHVLTLARAAGCYKVQLLSHKRHADDGAHALYLTTGFTAEAEGFRLYLNS